MINLVKFLVIIVNVDVEQTSNSTFEDLHEITQFLFFFILVIVVHAVDSTRKFVF